ncbi:MAG: DUF6263 family protein [Chitinophagales bacterium]
MKSVKFIIVLLIASQFMIGGCSSSKNQSAESAPEMSSSSKGKYLLKLNPEEGKTGKMVMNINMDIAMEAMGQSLNTTQKMEMASDLKVLSNTDEKVVTSMKYDYITISMDIPMMGTMEYDTRKEDNEGMMADAMGAAFGQLIDNEITLEQSHDGATLKTDGADGLAQMQSGQANMNISSMINMSQFPDKAIKIGESWNKKIEDAASPYTFDATYTLTKVEDGKVYIDLDSDVGMKEALAVEGEAVDTEMTGKQTGTFIYDQKTMWLIEAILNQDFDMEVEQMGMSMPMKLKGDIIMVME